MRACSVPGCGRVHSCKGYCESHYKRSLRGTPMDTPLKSYSYRDDSSPCVDCQRPLKPTVPGVRCPTCNSRRHRRRQREEEAALARLEEWLDAPLESLPPVRAADYATATMYWEPT